MPTFPAAWIKKREKRLDWLLLPIYICNVRGLVGALTAFRSSFVTRRILVLESEHSFDR